MYCILLHSGDEIFADHWSPHPIPIDRSLQQPTSQSPGVVPYVPENKWIKPDVLGLLFEELNQTICISCQSRESKLLQGEGGAID